MRPLIPEIVTSVPANHLMPAAGLLPLVEKHSSNTKILTAICKLSGSARVVNAANKHYLLILMFPRIYVMYLAVKQRRSLFNPPVSTKSL
jgi:hypothetical protein